MDKAQFIHRRKGKYMAQILEAFERDIEPLLPESSNGAVQNFKGLTRARLNALSVDAQEMLELGDGAVNGLAQQLRDRLSPVGRP